MTRTQALPVTPVQASRPHSSVSQVSPTPPGKDALSPNPLWAPPSSASAPQRVACRHGTLRLPRGQTWSERPVPGHAQHSPGCRNPGSPFLKCPLWAATSWTRSGAEPQGMESRPPRSRPVTQPWGRPPAPLPRSGLSQLKGVRRGDTQPFPADEPLPLKGF